MKYISYKTHVLCEDRFYLQLLLLSEPSHPFPSRSLPHEGHDPDKGLVAVKHLGDLLNTLTKR